MTESNRIEYKRELTNGKEIMRVFRDLEILEQLGSGVPRILKAYGREAFEIRKSFLRVVMPYAKPFDHAVPAETPVETPVETLVETPIETASFILKSLRKNPRLTLAEVAGTIGKSVSAVERASTKLVKAGKLKHVGPKKGGQWEVLDGVDE